MSPKSLFKEAKGKFKDNMNTFLTPKSTTVDLSSEIERYKGKKLDTIKRSLTFATIVLALAIVSALIQILLSIGLDSFGLYLVRTALPIILITGANVAIYGLTSTQNFCFGKGIETCQNNSKTLIWTCCIGVIVALTLIPGANTFFLVIFALMFFYSLMVLSMMQCTDLLPFLVTSVALQSLLLAGLFSLLPLIVSSIINVATDSLNSGDFEEFFDSIKDQFNPEKYMARFLGAVMVSNYCLNLNMAILCYLNNDAEDLKEGGNNQNSKNTIDSPNNIYALMLYRLTEKSKENAQKKGGMENKGGEKKEKKGNYYFSLIVSGTLNWIINILFAIKIIYEALHIKAPINVVEVNTFTNSEKRRIERSSESRTLYQSALSENRSEI